MIRFGDMSENVFNGNQKLSIQWVKYKIGNKIKTVGDKNVNEIWNWNILSGDCLFDSET